MESGGLFELVVLERRGCAVGVFDDEREIEDAHRSALDEVCNRFRYLTVELVAREAQHQVFDRSECHRSSFRGSRSQGLRTTGRPGITRTGWDHSSSDTSQ